MITLIELYEFFKACRIDYVNIFDLTCRSCKTRVLTESEIADIGNTEFSVSRNTKAFGPYKSKKRKKQIKRKKQTKKK
jgi:hypothetical protein